MFRILAGLCLALGLAAGGAVAQSSYRIQPGDVLQIEVVEDSGLNRSALVLPDGNISFPLVGSVRAAGQSVDDVRNALRDGIAGNFAAPPTVFVSVGSLAERAAVTGTAAVAAGMNVYIIGAANTPGRKEVEPGTTMLQFLAESGGLSRFAATKRIQLRRVDAKTGAEQVYTYNFHAVQSGTAPARSIVLAPGDVIVVPERRLFE